MADKKTKLQEVLEVQRVLKARQEIAKLLKKEEETQQKILDSLESQEAAFGGRARMEAEFEESAKTQIALLKQQETLLKEQESSERRQAAQYALKDKHIARFLTQNKAVLALSEKFELSQDGAAKKALDLAREIRGWETGLHKAVGYVKEITDDSAKASTVFTAAAKYYYKDIKVAAQDYLRLQRDIEAGSASTFNSASSALSTIGTGADARRVADAKAGIEKLRESQRKLVEDANAADATLGLESGTIAKQSNELKAALNLDTTKSSVREALIETTQQFNILVAKGVLPADASLTDFAKSANKFGLGDVKGLIEVGNRYRAISELPKKFVEVEKDKTSKVSQYLKQHAADLAQNAQKTASSLQTQGTNVVKLAGAYMALNVAAVKAGLSASNAGELSSKLLGHFAAKGQTTSVDESALLGAQELMARNRADGGQTIEALMKDFKGDDEMKKRVMANLTRAFATGSGYEAAYALKNVANTDIYREAQLKQHMGLLSNTGGAVLQNLVATKYDVKDADQSLVLADMLREAQSSGNYDAFFAKLDTVKAAEDAATMKSPETQGVTAAMKAAGDIKDPIDNFTKGVKTFVDAMGPTGAIALGLSASVVKGLLTAKAGSAGTDKIKDIIDKTTKGGKGGLGGGDCIDICKGNVTKLSDKDIITPEKPPPTPPSGTTPSGTTKAPVKESMRKRAADKARSVVSSANKKAKGFTRSVTALARKSPKAAAGLAVLGAATASGSTLSSLGSKAISSMTSSGGALLGKIAGSGSNLLQGVTGSLGSFAKKMPILNLGLAAYDASTIVNNEGKNNSEKTADMAALAASTVLRLNPITGGILLGKDLASLGAGMAGFDNTAKTLDLIDPSSLPVLGEYIGKSWYDLMSPGQGSTMSSVSPVMSSSSAPGQSTTQTTQYSQANTSSSASLQQQFIPPGSVMSQAKSTDMILNPDGSRQFDFSLTIPGFDQAVAQTMRTVNTTKPAGNR